MLTLSHPYPPSLTKCTWDQLNLVLVVIALSSVLCYTTGLPGAVNITQIDLERLNPRAFLNDSLLEFGLR